MTERGRERNRYNTSGLIEAQFEPGSRHRVLRNLLGTKKKREMDRIEAREHYRALAEILVNLRTARLLAILMGLQAKLPPLDFGVLKGGKRQEYFAAVRCGLDRNYEPMQTVFADVIKWTCRIHARA